MADVGLLHTYGFGKLGLVFNALPIIASKDADCISFGHVLAWVLDKIIDFQGAMLEVVHALDGITHVLFGDNTLAVHIKDGHGQGKFNALIRSFP